MKYKRFEELPVWNDAIEMALVVYQLSATGRLDKLGDLKSQIERATLSISNNIAEGFERGTNNELLHFLYIARGSSGEVRSMLRLLERFPGREDLHHDVQDLIRRAESISRQLGGWIESIKDSGFEGTRSQNTRTRERAKAVRRRDECIARLQAIQDEAARMPAPSGMELPPRAESTNGPRASDRESGKSNPESGVSNPECGVSNPESRIRSQGPGIRGLESGI